MLGTTKGVMALFFVLFIWTSYLSIPIIGWSRLLLAFAAVFKPSLRKRAISLWLRDDVMINGWLGGIEGHSISGRVGYRSLKTGDRHYLVMQWVIDKLFWFQPHHCFISIEWSLLPVTERVRLIKKHNSLFH
jgi:hypothetical protein